MKEAVTYLPLKIPLLKKERKLLNNFSIAKEWLDYAHHDLQAAEFLMKMTPKPLEIICYHCQQSAEKTLKAFLAFKNQEIPKVHDLTYLLDKCVELSPKLKKLQQEALDLTDYSTIVRYPFNIELNISDTKQALKNARKIYKIVENEIKSKE
ncbi:MAG: HEPN domain-containing protein [Kosmotogaceae bacterium]